MDLPELPVEALKGLRHLYSAYVFCLPDGRPLTDGMTKHALRRALRRVAVSRPEGSIGWHDLRHTYGSHLAMWGIALKVIQELLGHTTIEMTMRYAHLLPEARERAVQELDRSIPQPRTALGLETPDG